MIAQSIIKAACKYGAHWFNPADEGWVDLNAGRDYIDREGDQVRVKPAIVEALYTSINQTQHMVVKVYERQSPRNKQALARFFETSQTLAVGIDQTQPNQPFLRGWERSVDDVIAVMQDSWELCGVTERVEEINRAGYVFTDHPHVYLLCDIQHIPVGTESELVTTLYFKKSL